MLAIARVRAGLPPRAHGPHFSSVNHDDDDDSDDVLDDIRDFCRSMSLSCVARTIKYDISC